MSASRDDLNRALSACYERLDLLEDLLDEVLNEVPHGWGESFTDSELAGRIRQALEKKP